MVDVVTQLLVSPGATQHVLDDHADVTVLPAHEEPPSLANTCRRISPTAAPRPRCACLGRPAWPQGWWLRRGSTDSTGGRDHSAGLGLPRRTFGCGRGAGGFMSSAVQMQRKPSCIGHKASGRVGSPKKRGDGLPPAAAAVSTVWSRANAAVGSGRPIGWLVGARRGPPMANRVAFAFKL